MKQLTIYYKYYLLWYDFLRLKLAASFADFKSRKGVPHYVMPDEGDRLLVLSFADVQRLQQIGEIKYRTVGRVKIFVRKKTRNGLLRKKHVKRVTLGEKRAYGISRMNRNIRIWHIRQECFYGSIDIVPEDNAKKVYEWRTYMSNVRAKRHANSKS